MAFPFSRRRSPDKPRIIRIRPPSKARERARKAWQTTKKAVTFAALASIPIASGVGFQKVLYRLGTGSEISDLAGKTYNTTTRDIERRTDLSSNPLGSAILAEVGRRNAHAKPGTVYYVHPDKHTIEKLSLDLFQMRRLTSIRKFMGVYFKPIQTIVDRRAEAIAQEAMKNPDILDLIVKRVGKMDVHQYLLSLSPSELEKVFSPQEKKQIQQSIASLPEARLERIKDIIRSELPRIRFGSVLFGLMVGAAMAALVTSVNRKIKK